MALTPPFVIPLFNIIPNIESTPTLIFGSQQSCYIDSISFCNTTDNDLFFDLFIAGERTINNVLVAVQAYHSKKRLLKANQTLELELGALKSPQSGDLFYANSDFSGSTFDVLVSYRELTEVPQA